MGGVGRTQGPYRYRGGAGAGVSLGYILGGGGGLPQARAAERRPGGPPMVGTGLSLALHRYRGGAESSRRPDTVAVLVFFEQTKGLHDDQGYNLRGTEVIT